MALIYKCDRCGIEYSEPVRSKVYAGRTVDVETPTCTIRPMDKRLDLCQKCTEELNKFLNCCAKTSDQKVEKK